MSQLHPRYAVFALVLQACENYMGAVSRPN